MKVFRKVEGKERKKMMKKENQKNKTQEDIKEGSMKGERK